MGVTLCRKCVISGDKQVVKVAVIQKNWSLGHLLKALQDNIFLLFKFNFIVSLSFMIFKLYNHISYFSLYI